MGMAASQARFLGLTARKTNVEYEGQQVNQQRTCLANQSANYYNQLLGMTVPTPPSVADFTKTVYTFQDGNLSNSISSLIAKEDGSYQVSYTSSWTNDFAPVAAGTAIVMKEAANSYKIGAVTLRKLDGTTALTQAQILADPYLKTLSPDGDPNADQIKQLLAEEKEYMTLLNQKYGDDGSGWFVRYVQNSSTGTWSPMFYRQSDVKDETDGGTAIYSDKGTSQSNIPAYTMGSALETNEVKGVTARLEKDATGRYTSITLHSDDPAKAVTYSLTTNTLTDQDAYDSAMNQYEYDKHQYDQAIQEINAKIEIIQAQDKNLELRLKQLDTEQDAISQEMEAVSSVVQKNVESTFKTFG